MVDETPILEKLRFMDIAHWNHNEDDQLDLVNVGTSTDPKMLKLNVSLSLSLKANMESLFKEFIDIFVSSYKYL